MKTSVFLAVALTAVSAATEPTKTERDLGTVTSVVAQVSDAITKLDKSVKAFDGSDASALQSDSKALLSAITSGASTLTSSGDSFSLVDALGLQDAISPLGPAAEGLFKDIKAKKSQFESADLCDVVLTSITDVGNAAKSLLGGVINQMPEEIQPIAKKLAESAVDTLAGIASDFASDKCKNKGAAASSSAMAVTSSAAAGHSSAAAATSSAAVWTSPAATETIVVQHPAVTTAVTVTVTAPCVCEGTTTSAIPIITSSSIRPNSTFVAPTGNLTSTSTIPFVTAGAVAHGVNSGSVGLLAALAAFLFV
ncbi:hypothetical protein AAE478_005044 [Parahypoxylon ruwenzoriense]